MNVDTMAIQIGEVKQASATYQEFLDGVPSMYAIDGLPAGERAAIARFGNVWRILRINDDVPSTWIGEFETPQAAAAAIALEIDGALPQASRPQIGDGLVKQDQDGWWHVYRIEFDNSLTRLDGPFRKRQAIERLNELVPLKEGDHWSVDAWDVAKALNVPRSMGGYY